MQTDTTNLFLRNDTILGICEGLGQDLGFNPQPLRVVLAGGLLWNPAVIVGIYLALGVAVAVSRLLFPVADAVAEPEAVTKVTTADNADAEQLSLAA